MRECQYNAMLVWVGVGVSEDLHSDDDDWRRALSAARAGRPSIATYSRAPDSATMRLRLGRASKSTTV